MNTPHFLASCRQPITLMAALMIVVFSGCSAIGSNNERTVTTRMDESFTLEEGDSAYLEDENITLTFVNLVSDSRCPLSNGEAEINCVWEGEVHAVFQFLKDSETTEITLRGFIGPEGNEEPISREVGPYVVQLVKLDPFPVYQQEGNGPKVATLRIVPGEG